MPTRDEYINDAYKSIIKAMVSNEVECNKFVCAMILVELRSMYDLGLIQHLMSKLADAPIDAKSEHSSMEMD